MPRAGCCVTPWWGVDIKRNIHEKIIVLFHNFPCNIIHSCVSKQIFAVQGGVDSFGTWKRAICYSFYWGYCLWVITEVCVPQHESLCHAMIFAHQLHLHPFLSFGMNEDWPFFSWMVILEALSGYGRWCWRTQLLLAFALIIFSGPSELWGHNSQHTLQQAAHVSAHRVFLQRCRIGKPMSVGVKIVCFDYQSICCQLQRLSSIICFLSLKGMYSNWCRWQSLIFSIRKISLLCIFFSI